MLFSGIVLFHQEMALHYIQENYVEYEKIFGFILHCRQLVTKCKNKKKIMQCYDQGDDKKIGNCF